ncbi:MAG: DUF4282 domain-containing protein [Nesterenkonia sp.]
MTQPPSEENWEQPQGGQGNPPHQPAPSHRPGPDTSGFFKALFDFSFKSFVTIKFAAIIYGIALLLIGIFTLIGIIFAFVTMTEEPLVGFFMLVLTVILAPFYLILVRLTLELYVAMIRTAQNTAATTSALENLRWDMSQRS